MKKETITGEKLGACSVLIAVAEGIQKYNIAAVLNEIMDDRLLVLSLQDKLKSGLLKSIEKGLSKDERGYLRDFLSF